MDDVEDAAVAAVKLKDKDAEELPERPGIRIPSNNRSHRRPRWRVFSFPHSLTL